MHSSTVFDRRAKERREARDLAPYAMRSAASKGRRYPDEDDALRTCWERDRDRVVHCTAFRRLMYKTQVFVNSEGDHHRTRLSHTLEVCQVARSVGSALALNEPLCETIALAHDLGHPPFGHSGERVLDELMKSDGGFRHNSQGLRVIDLLERRSPSYPGLNLTLEVRASVLKHESEETWPTELGPRTKRAWLETQVVDLADSTAYDVHDIEDGLNALMFSEDELFEEVELWRRSCAEVEARHPGFLCDTQDRKLRIKRIANELIGTCINDLILASRERLESAGLETPEDARCHALALIGHSPEIAAEVRGLESFLHRRFYRHEHLQRFQEYARNVLSSLFQALLRQAQEMAPWYRDWAEEVGTPRAICDYLAGMTDRFAEQEYRRLGH